MENTEAASVEHNKDQGSAAYGFSHLEVVKGNFHNAFTSEQHTQSDKDENGRNAETFEKPVGQNTKHDNCGTH